MYFFHSGGIQNIKDGHTSVCSQNKAANGKLQNAACCTIATLSHLYWAAFSFVFSVSGVLTRSKRQIYSPKISGTVHSVPEGVPFYLSCPIESYHAKYTWKHGSHERPCLQMVSNCLHLIPSMGPENYGEYECVSTEKDYSKTLKKYHLKQQQEKQESRFADFNLNDAPILAPQLFWILLQTAVLWEILR